MRMYFEDFELGQVFELGERTLTREQMLAFSTEFDPQPIHIDEQRARASLYGGLIASGWHTGSVLMRLLADGLLNKTTSLGSPGLDELRWLAPVRPGDTVRGRSTIETLRPSRSRPEMGLALVRSELFNQHDDLVVMMRSWGMFERRPR